MKKHVKITLVLSIIWAALVLLFLILTLIFRGYNRELTTFNDVTESGSKIYITDNTSRGGIIYEINSRGVVDGMFQTVAYPIFSGYDACQVYSYDGMVYAVLGCVREDRGQKIHEYQIVEFDEELGVSKRTPPFRAMMTLALRGLSMDEEGAELTFLSANGQQAFVYLVPFSDFAEVTKLHPSSRDEEAFKKREVGISERLVESCEAGRFFSDAQYENGVLHTRLDNEEPEGIFAIDPAVQKLFSNRKMGLFWMIAATGINFLSHIVALIIGVVVIGLIVFFLRMRRRVAYAVFAFEVVLGVMIGGVFLFMMQKTRDITSDNYERFERYFIGTLFENLPEEADLNFDSEGFYSTDTYALLQNRIASEIASSEGAVKLKDILIVRSDNGIVAFSGSGRNRESVRNLYGEDAEKLLTRVNEQNRTASLRADFQGAEHSFIVQLLDSEDFYGYTAIGVSEYADIREGFFDNYGNILRFSVIIFLVGSIAGLIFFLLQAADLRLLQGALKKVANDQEVLEKPIVVGTDMNFMWNSVFEIQRKIRKTNRIKFLTYEAYYRFAPKSIERILKKDSITEVRSGNAIQLSGTMALLSTTGQRTDNPMDLDRLNHFMEIIETYQKQEDGIFISSGGDLSEMRFLFLEETRSAGRFGVDLLEALREWKKSEYPGVCILMHYAPYIYGIAGTENQAAAFLSSPETEDLSSYMEWFRDMRLGLLITSDAKDHEEVSYDLRYIGFVTPNREDPEKRVEIYEVLDACSVRARARRLRMLEKFKEALDLFYKQDFYFARNVFTDVLREMPEDEITKWYLFECERYLNEADGSNFVGALRPADR